MRFHVKQAGAHAKLIKHGPLGVAYLRRHPISTVPVARITAHDMVAGENCFLSVSKFGTGNCFPKIVSQNVVSETSSWKKSSQKFWKKLRVHFHHSLSLSLSLSPLFFLSLSFSSLYLLSLSLNPLSISLSLSYTLSLFITQATKNSYFCFSS